MSTQVEEAVVNGQNGRPEVVASLLPPNGHQSTLGGM
jgi:hypothetical protein